MPLLKKVLHPPPSTGYSINYKLSSASSLAGDLILSVVIESFISRYLSRRSHVLMLPELPRARRDFCFRLQMRIKEGTRSTLQEEVYYVSLVAYKWYQRFERWLFEDTKSVWGPAPS